MKSDGCSKRRILAIVAVLALLGVPALSAALSEGLTQAINGGVADPGDREEVLEKAAEAVDAGVDEGFLTEAVGQGLEAGLSPEDLEEMIEDLAEAVEEGGGQDLNQVVSDHLAGAVDDDSEDDADTEDDDDEADTDDESLSGVDEDGDGDDSGEEDGDDSGEEGGDEGGEEGGEEGGDEGGEDD